MQLLTNPLKRTWLARATAALLVVSAFTVAPHAQASVFLSVNIAPPLLPVYEQPYVPGPGYLWTPGYWAYEGRGGYYWVPGTWVRAPYRGALWTPGYWGWGGNAYLYHGGYWGRHVGYYGGINYGFGYTGEGYNGGYWNRDRFYYNTAYNRVGNVHITNIYNRRVVNNVSVNRYSFNGPGGANRRPTANELAFQRERHTGPIGEQVRQRELARHNESLRAAVNHGSPPITATPRAGVFGRNAAAPAPGAHAANSSQPAGRHEVAKRMENATQRPEQRPNQGVHPSQQRVRPDVVQHQQPAHELRNDRPASPMTAAESRQRMPRNAPADGPRQRPAMRPAEQGPNPGMRGRAPQQDRQAPRQRTNDGDRRNGDKQDRPDRKR